MRDDVKKILLDMIPKRASDLHLCAHFPMQYRIDNDLVKVTDKVISPEEVKNVVYSILTPQQIEKFEEEKELDFAISVDDKARYRGNVFQQRGSVGCAIRLIPMKGLSIEECGLPVEVVQSFCRAQRGLVLVTGITGSGKSTTLSGMVEHINETRKCHIITVEDPIEYVHENKLSIIDQRQLNEDTKGFGTALKYVLRQDPDVILIGEMRDLDTIQSALIIADTGHLVLATLHTSDATQSINRIIDVFPAHQQRQIRAQLSFVMLGIISQQLIPRSDGPGRVLSSEVLVATPAVRSMIRDAKEHQIYSIIQTSQKFGMSTMNQSLANLYRDGTISYEEAIGRSSDAEELTKLLE